MEITEVRVKLVERPSERLRAFCSITLDGDFVIRDLKIIGGTNGAFVAMPSRKLSDRCPKCGCKNHLRARFCNDCGQKLNDGRAPKDGQGRAKLHADVAHPINAACRERIQKAVIEAYQTESERAESPDYKPAKYDDYEFEGEEETKVKEVKEVKEVEEVVSKSPPNAKDDGESEAESEGEGFADYNSLIADLKQEAATRHGERHKQEWPDRDHAEREQEVPAVADPAEDRQPPDRLEPATADHSPEPAEAPAAVEAPVSATPAPTPPSSPASAESDQPDDGFGAGLF